MAKQERRTRSNTTRRSRQQPERGQLRAFVERVERLSEEKKAIADDIKDVFAEAKGNGFDTKIMRQHRSRSER